MNNDLKNITERFIEDVEKRQEQLVHAVSIKFRITFESEMEGLDKSSICVPFTSDKHDLNLVEEGVVKILVDLDHFKVAKNEFEL